MDGGGFSDLVFLSAGGRVMRIKFKFAGAKQTDFSEYALRFFFGGVVTVITGMVAKKLGAGIGGLFLAFPAIFPATATLIASREKEKKCAVGMDGTMRGREAAAIEARSTAYGTVGLVAFALIVWRFLPRHNASLVLIVAAGAWLIVAVLLWWISRQAWAGRRVGRAARRYTKFKRVVQDIGE
jgi:Protein of unknown function (DUF3147)